MCFYRAAGEYLLVWQSYKALNMYTRSVKDFRKGDAYSSGLGVGV